MNELQIGLLGLGSVVVASVIVYNRLQERKYRRQTEQIFTPPQDDALLDAETRAGGPDARQLEMALDAADAPEPVVAAAPAVTADAEPSLGKAAPMSDEADAREPVLTAAPAVARPSRPAEAPSIEEALPPSVDPEIDYVAWILNDQPVAAGALKKRLRQQPGFTKSVLWLGLVAPSGHWEEVMRARDDAQFIKLVARVQLVDRVGTISARDLMTFTRIVQDIAGEQKAICPDIETSRKQAVKLDNLCAEVDVQVGLNILGAGGVFSAARIRDLAEAHGLKLLEDGVFHRLNPRGQTRFTLTNFDGAPFSAEQIRQQETAGITLLLDVPRVEEGSDAFAEMVEVGASLAQALGADLVDDNRRVLTETGIQTIQRQLGSLYAKMAETGVRAGSASALRLFS